MADDVERRGNRDTAKLVGIVVLVVVLLAFVIDNTDEVDIGFVFTDFEVPLIFVLIVTAIVGAVIDRLWLRRRR
jgi:uncharacterized integral membrane protein